MLYFKDKKGEVFAYENQAQRDYFGSKDLVKMTDSDIQAHLAPKNPKLSREQVENIRLRAYADPLTGSDRFFAEAVRLQAIGAPSEEIDLAKSSGVQRYKEIQAANPWPTDSN